jgi:uncharacterized repeat protein (TIGR01451 family)
LSNTATIGDDGTNGPDLNPGNNTSGNTTPVAAFPDLSVVKSDQGATVAAGAVVVYTLTYSNTGTQGATGVVLSEALPPHTVFAAGSSTPGWVETSPGSGLYTFSVGNVPVGATGTVQFAVQVAASLPAGVETIANTAVIADDGSNGPDLNPNNNTSTDETPVIAAPDLSVTKKDGECNCEEYEAGDVIVYTITYTNNGTQDATGVVISETLPAYTSFVVSQSTPGWIETFPGSGQFRLAIGDVAVGQTGSALFAVQVASSLPAGVEEIFNTVSIADDGSNGPDLNPDDNTAIDATPVLAAPDLTVTKKDGECNCDEYAVGDVIVYTITYTNNGTQDATGVVIRETLPAYTTFIVGASTSGWVETVPGSGEFRFHAGDVAAGASYSLLFAVRVADVLPAGVSVIVNTVSIVDDGSNGPDLNPADNTATDETPVVAAPDLSLIKSDAGATVEAGAVVVYTLTYTNTGTQGATGVVLSETLPPYTSFAASSSTLGWVETSPGSGVFTFSVGNVPIGAVGSVQFALQVASTLPAGVEAIANTATITDDGSNGPDLNPADNSSTDSTAVLAAPDLSVTKKDGECNCEEYSTGDVIVYTITYTNNGTQGATGVVISETLPAFTTFVLAASTPGWVETFPGSGQFRYAVGSVPVGTTGSVLFAVRVVANLPAGVESIVNTVTIADDGSNGADLDPSDNTAVDTTPVIAAPDLSVVKTDGNVSVAAGGLVVYTLSYTNTGTQGATGVAITESVPTYATFVSGSSTSGWIDIGGGQFRIQVGDVPVGATGTVEFAVRLDSSLPAGVESIVNTATIADDGSNGPDLNPADNTATDTTPVTTAPDLSVTKKDGECNCEEYQAGGIVVYTITYANNGSQNSTGVVIHESLPLHTTFVVAASSPGWVETFPGSGQFRYQVGNVAVGTSGSVLFAVRVAASLPAGVDRIVNTVSITDDGANGADANPTDNTAVDETPVVAAPDLSVVKTDHGAMAVPGGLVVYTLSYTNTGTQDATGVAITETVPTYATFVSGSSTSGWVDIGGGQFRFPVGNVPVGSSGIVQFAIRIASSLPAGVEQIANAAAIADDGNNGPDLNPADNIGTDVTPVLAAPDLSVTKKDGECNCEEYEAGDVVVYTITYTNNGTQDATGVTISETLPANTSFVWADSTAGWIYLGGGQYRFPVGNVAVGQTGTVLFAVRVDASLPAGVVQIANTVSIADDGSNGPDLNPSDNTATDLTPVIAAPDLYVTKTDDLCDCTPTPAGGVVVYTLTYGNIGTQGATGVVLTETLPAYTSFSLAGSASGWTETFPGSGVLVYQVGNLAVGQTGSVQFAVRINAALPAGVERIENTARIRDDGANGADLNPGNDTGSDTSPVLAAPDLSITKSDDVNVVQTNQTVVYTLTYRNTGTQGATGVVIRETVPSNTMFDAANSTPGWVVQGANVLTFPIGSVPVGATGTVQFAVRVVGPLAAGVQQIENTVTIFDDGANGPDLNPADNTASEPTILDAAPDLGVTKTGPCCSVETDAVVVYSIQYANSGTRGATGVVLAEQLPAYTTFVPGSSTVGWLENPPGSGTYKFQVGNVPAGSSGTVQFAVRVAPSIPAGVHALANTVTIADDGLNGVDPNPGNNTGSANVPVSAAPDLVVTKTDGGATVTAGGTVVYTVGFSNVGTQGATGVVLTERVPQYSSFNADASTPGWVALGGGVYTYPVGAVAVGASGNILFGVTVSNNVPPGVNAISNTVTITDDGLNGPDLNPGDNSAGDDTPLNAAPDLSIRKQSSDSTRPAGSILVYTLHYANVGSQGATGVLITETLPAHTSYSTSGSTPGWRETAPGSRVFTFEIAAVAAGATGQVAFAVRVDDPLPAGVEAVVNTVSIGDDGTNGADPNLANNTDGLTVSVIAAPDLTISKTDHGVLAQPGQTLAYTLNYANVGSQGATGVVITETLPPHTSFDPAASASGWVSQGSGQFAYPIAQLSAGSAGSVVFAVRVNQFLPLGVSNLVNAVSVGDDGSNGPDANPNDNSTQIVTPVASADILGNVWYDFNANGVRDAGEPGLPNVTVTLRNSAGQVVGDPVKTDLKGDYGFFDLPTGTYTVHVTQPAGTRQTDDPDDVLDNKTIVVLLPAEVDAGNDFGYTGNSSLSGTVYVDRDRNQVLSAPDTGIPNVRITLTGTDAYGNLVSRILFTNSGGFYRFDNLLPGLYAVREDQPPQYSDGPDQAGSAGGKVFNDFITDIQIGANVNATGYNFGEIDPLDSSKRDFVWPPCWTNPHDRYDVNNDGYITPLDALILIREINSMDTLTTPPGLGEAEASDYPYFVDVNGDGYLTPQDVLNVIRTLNELSEAAVSGAVSAPASTPTSSQPSRRAAAPADIDSVLMMESPVTSAATTVSAPATADAIAEALGQDEDLALSPAAEVADLLYGEDEFAVAEAADDVFASGDELEELLGIARIAR